MIKIRAVCGILVVGILSCLLIKQVHDVESIRLTPKEIKDDYEYMWKTLEENFPLFEAIERIYGIDRKQVYTSYKEKCEKLPVTDVVDYYDLLNECLDEFEFVGHLSIADPSVYYANVELDDRTKAEVKKWHNRSERTYEFLQKELEEKAENFTETSQSVSDGNEKVIHVRHYEETPIIKIDSFWCSNGEDVKEMVQELTGILQKVQDAEQIVFDLRGNRGGSTQVWEDSILPYLGRQEIYMTTYSARINGGMNQQKFPISVDEVNRIADNSNVVYLVEPYDISQVLEIQEMGSLHISDLERCDVFLKTEMKVSIGELADFNLDGDIIVFIDQYTASAATDMAWFFQNARLATIVGTENAGVRGAFSLPPSLSSFILPNSGLMVRYEPYYILREDGECAEFGMNPDFIINEDESVEWWLWKREHEVIDEKEGGIF